MHSFFVNCEYRSREPEIPYHLQLSIYLKKKDNNFDKHMFNHFNELLFQCKSSVSFVTLTELKFTYSSCILWRNKCWNILLLHFNIYNQNNQWHHNCITNQIPMSIA
eukprot:317846_1